MSEFLGGVEIPEIVPSGVFPIVPDYGYGRSHQPQVAIHRFGSANAKIEQRFLLGTGARRFTVRRAQMRESDRIALRDFWEDKYGPYGAFTYNAPNDDGNGTTAYTCRFANEPLSWEFLSDAISSTGVTLIEIPSTSPAYTLNSTVTRFPSDALKTALLSQTQEIIPLVKIQPREAGYPAIYVSDRRCTVGSQLYQARLLEFDGISQSIGNESDQAQFTFGNADRVMRELSIDTDLFRASIEFSLFHVGTGIKLDLWKGEAIDWSLDSGPEFAVTAADGMYELTLPYPTRRVSRSCWKCFDDGAGCRYTAESTGLGPGADANSCDKGYSSANGCVAHGMKHYFGGILAEPQGVRIKDNSTGTWGFRRSSITSVSLVSESIYDQVIPEIYTDSPMPVNCKIAAGREESDFYNALGIVGEGPLTFGYGHKLDGQYHHGYPGLLGYRYAQGFDPANAGDYFALGPTYKDNFAAGTAFLELRRHDEKGLQLTQVSGHDMQAVVATGLNGWVWSAAGVREQQVLTNPIWIAVNMLLRARGLRFADAATAEQYFDVNAAIAAAGICAQSVTKLVGSGSETQFKFRGVIQEEKPLRDWIQEILMNCLGYYSFAFGKLKLGVRVNSSVIEAFTEGNIVFQSLRLASLKPAFNHLTANFADEEFEFAANSVTVYDIDHAKFVGGATAPLFLKSQANLSGSSGKSQAARIISARLREELGGITAEQWKAARQIAFQTTVLALNTEPGMVCSMTHPDMPAGVGEFRVTAWRLNKDYSIEIQGQTTVDEMYDMVVGPKPADVGASPLPVEPPSWNQRAVGGKSVAGVGNATGDPTLTELFVQDDSNPDIYHRKVKVEFTPPPTEYSDLPRRAEISTPAVQATGGSIPGNQTLYVEVCARAAGEDGLASDPLQIVIPAGTNTNKFTLLCRLPDAAMTHYSIRVGPRVGRMYGLGAEIASPGTDWFAVEVTDVSTLNSASLSPDPRFHHVRVFYFYDGSPGNVRDAGTTSGPTDNELVFQPETPETADSKITVVLCSANAAETARYPFDWAPRAELSLTSDAGNPSGAANLAMLTQSDDANIPPGCVVFQFDRDTSNYKSIYGVAAILSGSLPAQGPYSAERAAYPGATLEGPIACTVTAGSRRIACTRSASAAVVGRVLLIYSADGTPDSDLEGNIIQAQGENYYEIDRPFSKAGAYTCMVVKRWWDSATAGESANAFYHWFPIDQLGDVNQATWRTPPVPYPVGTLYASVYSRNRFGVGARITAGPTVFISASVPVDSALPGQLVNLHVTAEDGKFIAHWDDPVTGNNTLDAIIEQWSEHADFSSPRTYMFGYGRSAWGFDPNKTYYFRFAAHNQSGLPSHADTAGLWADGAGPWTVAPENPVSSPHSGLNEVDTTVPGAVQNFVVTASEGRFYAKWLAPATGKHTIDDYLIQASPNVDFSSPRYTVPLGNVLAKDGADPDQLLYWRVSAHNRSGVAGGDAAQLAVHPNGWGPWTTHNAVNSGAINLKTGQVAASDLSLTARAQYGVFDETFEEGAAGESIYNMSGNGALLYPSSGVKGGLVLRATGVHDRYLKGFIPFNPTQLYRLKVRFRALSVSDPAHDYFVINLLGYNASQTYVGTAAIASIRESTLTPGTWYEYTHWIKGMGTGGAGTVTNPWKMPTGSIYFKPEFAFSFGDTAFQNQVECDYFTIDSFDEDGQNRIYLAAASNGEINPDKVIETSITNNAVTTNKIVAGSITAGKISATILTVSDIRADLGTITAGTITGATIRTAASGKRVLIDSASGLRAYNSSGTLRTQIFPEDVVGIETSNIAPVGYQSGWPMCGFAQSYIAAGWSALTSGGRIDIEANLWLRPKRGSEVYLGNDGSDGGVITVKSDGLYMQGKHIEFDEYSPAAPGADKARLFARDNGAGKTQLCVVFNTGVVQVIATQP